MRLIDADELTEMECMYCPLEGECGGASHICLISILMANAPTAFDMNKVLDELDYIETKWDKACPEPNEYGEPVCSSDCVECQIRRCKSIIKRGVMND